jgi:hypothetical protein
MNMNELRKLREKIEQTLNEEKEKLETYEAHLRASMENPNHISDNVTGWTEALTYVLEQIDAMSNTDKYERLNKLIDRIINSDEIGVDDLLADIMEVKELIE